MVSVNHDWDEPSPKEELESAFRDYFLSCYAGQTISRVQQQEVRQAFLSGVHWLAGRESYDPDEIQAALKSLLRQ